MKDKKCNFDTFIWQVCQKNEMIKVLWLPNLGQICLQTFGRYFLVQMYVSKNLPWPPYMNVFYSIFKLEYKATFVRRRSTVISLGRRRSTVISLGRRRSTGISLGRRRSTVISLGRRRSTVISLGRRRSTVRRKITINSTGQSPLVYIPF